MRRVAFEPDGLNEFLYAPYGAVQCSTSRERFDVAAELGAADVTGESRFGEAIWIDRDLDDFGLGGLRGTIVAENPFAIVAPAQSIGATNAGWVQKELVLLTHDGRHRHRSGDPGLYARALGDARIGEYRTLTCDKDAFHCVASETSFAAVARQWSHLIAAGVVLVALIAAWIAARIRTALARYWSLKQRFCRYLSEDSVVCAYQPIMDIRSGEIIGCEVLARWRDVNGDIVYPDKFIGIVESAELTRRFTKMVVDKAFRELSSRLPSSSRYQVNFNVFPCDLDSAWLREVFSVFASMPGRFDIVAELVESDAVTFETAQREIEALSKAGIKTYIDDFGAGYSNIHNLASLAVNGVKLDRSFAMAPDNSMMAKMLVHALDMVETSGRALLVEGVETRERLALLRSTQQVDFVQGYLVSRPLSIERFTEFLANHDQAPWSAAEAA